MGAAGVVALLSFIENLPPDSALYKKMNPKDEWWPWATTAKTNFILADIFDVFVAANTKKGHKRMEYPRPKEKQTIGKDPIPISEFWDWWNSNDEEVR